MLKLFFLLFSACLLVACSHRQGKYEIFKHSVTNKPYVIMVSFDGFRWDYPDSVVCPNLNKIASEGVRSELVPCFPTKTFPNHYSLATGLYPDHHGIVQNTFFATEIKKEYIMGKPSAVENGEFYGGEPIWVTAEKQNVRTAACYWVGSEARIKGFKPTYWKSYSNKMPDNARVDTLEGWLKQPPAYRPHLIAMYFDEPDHTGHDNGPSSDQTRSAVKRMDEILGRILNKIKNSKLADSINLIVCSDHGMQSISDSKVEVVKEYIEEDWCTKIYTGNPVFLIKAKAGKEAMIEAGLKKAKHLKFWKTNTLPERLHYGTNPRCLDYVVVADSAYSLKWSETDKIGKGGHGFDNRNRNMHAIFYAKGPAFKKNLRFHKFDNIDIYPMIAKILDLKPEKVDGSLDNVKEILSH